MTNHIEWIQSDPTLDTLESTNDWENVYLYLINLDYIHRTDTPVYLRGLTSNWYALSEANLTDSHFEAFYSLFLRGVHHGRQNLYNDYRFLTLLGYMVSVSPHLFPNQLNATALLKQAEKLSNHNLFVHLLYLGSIGSSQTLPQYEAVKSEFSQSSYNWLVGNSAFERYFREVLSTSLL